MSHHIRAGMQIQVRTAYGNWRPKIATSGIEPGHNFPIVWARRPDGTEDSAVPWPAEDVRDGWEQERYDHR